MAGLDNEEPNELVAELVEKLTPDERLILLRDLHSKKLTADGFERMDTNKDGKVDPQEFQAYMKEMNDNQFRKPTTRQMVWVMVASGVPFIGFGFMDNALMICFGETIEINIGALLGLSTMACAAGGNMVSDVVGVGMAGYIETLAKSLGIRDPLLTPSQLKMWGVRFASSVGAALGISLGCVLGMFPLLFFEDHGKDDKEEGTKK
mmetsp:Transcript_42060/g.102664  ORF Transcript_42060/g.102664 Transcript_42060/m.102664 type:complete len:206 (+) Transcript_42060:477-1094(+)